MTKQNPPPLSVQERKRKDGFDEAKPSPVERARTKIGEGGASSPPYAVKPPDQLQIMNQDDIFE
ncbi:MAG: hypothetical protein A2017_06215 [Lentisphaerae bacterium GWF2_44_16]|nr:MAG: hypothetical protein A2017_06215 [Lentisphaerae bacterium GWF2_44_16]